MAKKILYETVPKYIGDSEVYFPDYKKIINKGDLLPEMSIKEAQARKDFIVINVRKDK